MIEDEEDLVLAKLALKLESSPFVQANKAFQYCLRDIRTYLAPSIALRLSKGEEVTLFVNDRAQVEIKE